MIDRLVIFGLSVLEAIAINYFFGSISQYNPLGKMKLIVFSILLGIVATITDYLEISYHLIITIVAIIVIFHLVSKYKFIDSSIDLIFSLGIFLIIQIIITVVATSIYEKIIDNNLLILLLLVIIVIISIVLYKTAILRNIVIKYYQSNKKIIFVVFVNIVFLVIIISKMIYYNKDQLFSVSTDILLVFIGCIIANTLTTVVLIVYINEKQRGKIIVDYSDSLESTVNEFKSLTHEYNSHLQILISMLEENGKTSEEKNEYARDYLSVLTNSLRSPQQTSFVINNILISAVLHHASVLAQQLDIKFDTSIETSQPNFDISDNDIVDILLNLINNAFEEVYTLPKEDRVVTIIFTTDSIEVVNRISKETSSKNPRDFFEKGFSTKGLGRGYGISNIISILDKYNFRLDSEVVDNYYIARICFKKTEPS